MHQPFDGYPDAKGLMIDSRWEWLAKRRLRRFVAIGYIDTSQAHQLLEEWKDHSKDVRARSRAAKKLWRRGDG